MNRKTEIRKENLIQEYRELMELWDGKDLKIEQKINDIAGELEEMGIKVEDLE